MKWLHRLVMKDSCAKRYLGSRHSNFDCPMGVVQAILRIFGLRTETKRKRINGEIVRFYRITDPLHHFNPDKLLKHWKARPELVLGNLEAAQKRRRCDGLSVIESTMQIIRHRD